MSERRFSPTELAEVAAGLRRLLGAVQGGELTADSGTVARLEGAAVALEALAIGRPVNPAYAVRPE